jgi:hypothetical protein
VSIKELEGCLGGSPSNAPLLKISSVDTVTQTVKFPANTKDSLIRKNVLLEGAPSSGKRVLEYRETVTEDRRL